MVFCWEGVRRFFLAKRLFFLTNLCKHAEMIVCLSRTEDFNNAEIKSICSTDVIWLSTMDCGSWVGMRTGWIAVGSMLVVVDVVVVVVVEVEVSLLLRVGCGVEMDTDCGTNRRHSTRPQLHIINGAGSGCDGS